MLEQGRKITTILAADVVDYSRLMSVDDAGTLAALTVRRGLFDRLVGEFDGREFGSAGDSLMAEFRSAVNAVRCAQAIQRAVGKENELLAGDRRMALRIGLDLGDVIEKDALLFGDAVNVAARLQSLAAPGGILLSRAVYEQVKSKLNASFTYIGARHVKNISEPVACYEVTEPAVASFTHRVAARFGRRHWLWLTAAATGVAAIVAAVSWQWWGAADEIRNTSIGQSEKSIAVLPFVNMSGDVENEYFADGLSEELLNLLARIPDLRVAARSSAFSFKGKEVNVQDVAQKLNVAHVLEGSVRKSGNRVRITAQLIKAADGYHLWSQTFNRTLGDIFVVQDDIAGAVVKELQVTLLGTALATGAKPPDPEAYNLFLKARYFHQLSSREDLERAINYYRQSLERDPAYATAWACLSLAYSMQAASGFAPAAEGFRRAREAAEKAVALDPQLVDAHLAIGWMHADDWDWAAADASFHRALELEPGNGRALTAIGVHAFIFGRWDEAMDAMNKAIERDPLVPAHYVALGSILEVLNRDTEAESEYRKALELDPGGSGQHLAIGRSLLFQGKTEAALGEMQLEKEESLRLSGLPLVFHALGRRSESNATLAALKSKYGGVWAYQIAQAHAFRGEADLAFEWLERAYDQRDSGVTEIKGDRLFRTLAADPRYKAFVKKMKFP